MIGKYKIPESKINASIKRERFILFLLFILGFINLFFWSLFFFILTLFSKDYWISFFILIFPIIPFLYLKYEKKKLFKKYQEYSLEIKEDKIIWLQNNRIIYSIFWSNAMNVYHQENMIISNTPQKDVLGKITNVIFNEEGLESTSIIVRKEIESFDQIETFILNKIQS